MDKTVIVFDGLDGVGKSTISTGFIHHIMEKFHEDERKIILYQHFPNYKSLTGYKIRKTLSELPENMSVTFLDNLVQMFMKDREIWWKTNSVDFYTYPDNTEFYIIFDRYRFSNLFLNAYRYADHDMSIGEACEHIMNLEKNFDYPTEDINIIISADWKVIEERMEKKRNTVETDKNETAEAVKKSFDNFTAVTKWMTNNAKSIPPFAIINEADIRNGKTGMEDLWNKIQKKIK